MRILVTGGAGFIGSHLTHALKKAEHELLVIDNLSSGKKENLPDGVELAQIDITSTETERVIADFQPQAVYHLAAQMDVRHSVRDPVFDANTNVTGTVRVASAAQRAGTRHFLFASSGGAIYGEQEAFPADEKHPTRPSSPYGVSKLSAEIYLEHFGRHSDMRPVALRFANVYGPRQDPHGEAGVVAIFAGLMLKNEMPKITGDGHQTRDYVYVGDVVAAFLSALTHLKTAGPYNIGSGRETSVNVLAAHMADIIGYKGEFQHVAAAPGEQRRSVLDYRRAIEELDWSPKVSLKDGLIKTIESFR